MALSNSLQAALVEFLGTLDDSSDAFKTVAQDVEVLGDANRKGLAPGEDAAHGILSRLYGGVKLSERSGGTDLLAAQQQEGRQQ